MFEAQAEAESAKAFGGHGVKMQMAYKSVGGRGAKMAAPRRKEMGAMAVFDAPPPDFNRDGYDSVKDAAYKLVQTEPLSTFSIDVDTSSYSNMRRFIEQDHRLPVKDAVRIEELINYFTYDYPDAPADKPFSVTTALSTAPWNPAHPLLQIGLQGKKIDKGALPHQNLVFLIDISGSMCSPDRLPLLKQAFRLLVDNLNIEDSVSIVTYASGTETKLEPTTGKHKDKIIKALEDLQCGGYTAGASGIRLAYDAAQKAFIKGGNNRVILATDGDFNVGQTSDSELVTMIEEKRKTGVFLTVLNFGRGNYQDATMQKLAQAGNGNAAYIDSLKEARKVLVQQMGGTLLTIAKDVKIQVEFNPAKVKAYRLIGYETRALAAQDFNDDKKDAGDLGSGHTVTAFYELIPAGSDEEIPGVDPLKYQKTAPADAASADEFATVKLRYKAPDGDKSDLISTPITGAPLDLEKTSTDFRFAAAVAAFGQILRDSEFKGSATFDLVLSLAKAAKGKDEDGLRQEFIDLVEKAKKLPAQRP